MEHATWVAAALTMSPPPESSTVNGSPSATATSRARRTGVIPPTFANFNRTASSAATPWASTISRAPVKTSSRMNGRRDERRTWAHSATEAHGCST